VTSLQLADSGTAPDGLRHLTPGTGRWFQINTFLVLTTGVQLFLLTEHTDRFFAWTIAPAITAASWAQPISPARLWRF
jgi:hypothetical protein